MKGHRKKKQDLLVSAIYGGSESDNPAELEEAIGADEGLAREYNEMKETLAFIEKARLVREPDAEFWRGVWPKLQRRIKKEEQAREPGGRRESPLVWNWKPALQIAIVAAMLVLGIFIGRMISLQDQALTEERYQESATQVSIPFEREIEEKTQDYFVEATSSSLERTSRLIKGFMEIQPQDWSAQGGMIYRNRKLGNEILSEISSLREGLSDPRFMNIDPILEELELFIGEIAGIEGNEEDLWFEIKSLQRGITERNLLDRLRAAQIQLVSLKEKRPSEPFIWRER